ncbi:hypothetical protein [Kribbella hippodromi]
MSGHRPLDSTAVVQRPRTVVCGSYLHRSSTYTLRTANVYLYNTNNGRLSLSGVYRIR